MNLKSIVFTAMVILSFGAGAANISLTTDLPVIDSSQGRTLSLSAAIAPSITENMTESDIYIALQLENGNLLTYTSDGKWNTTIVPYAARLPLTNLTANKFMSVTAPLGTPIGNYKFWLVVAKAGSDVLDGANWLGSSFVNVQVRPLTVFSTSYENAKRLNIPGYKIPDYPFNKAENYGEGGTGGVAYGDFFQEGSISMVVFSNRWNVDTSKPNPAGRVQFFKFDAAGNPVDYTSTLLSDQTGCEAPRKLLVADFNGDGKPDVYASCTGNEFGPSSKDWKGEKTRILLSQANGKYSNEATELNCYCHSSAAADLNGDGKVDIITSDWMVSRPFFGTDPNISHPSSIFVLTNDGTGHFTIKQDTNYTVVPQRFMIDTSNGIRYPTTNNSPTLELVDVTGDGKPDLLMGSDMDSSGRFYVPHHIFANNGNGTFSTFALFRAGVDTRFWALDFVVNGSDIYVYGPNYSGGNSGYDYLKIMKYNVNTKAFTSIWNSNGKRWPKVVVSPTDFVWVMPYNGTLVPYNSLFGEAIPMN